MQMIMEVNMRQRQQLLQKLELRSENFENALVRTEALLKERRYQKGLVLLRPTGGARDYRGVIDWLVGMLVPTLRAQIFRFYDNVDGSLIKTHAWEDIDRLDREMVVALGILARIRESSPARLSTSVERQFVAFTLRDEVLKPLFTPFPLAVARSKRKSA